MQHLATALAIAICHIEDQVSDADADMKALEAIASEIMQGSPDERRSIADALTKVGRTELVSYLGISSR